MSDRDQEIIATLRLAYDAFSRADFDAALEIAHPEIEFVLPGGQSSLRGTDALRAWMEPDAFEEQHVEPRKFRIHGSKVLVDQHNWIRGATSGIELEMDLWVVWTLDDDGLVTRMESYLSHQKAEALKAAGLSE